MSIVITGATGQFGSFVLKALVKRGVNPRDLIAAGRNVDKLHELSQLGVTSAQIDYDDPESLEHAFAGADKLLLVSGSALSARVQQHRNAIDAASSSGISQIVYTSVLGAADSPLVVAEDHRDTESYLRDSTVGYVIARNTWYTENFIPEARQARDTGHLAFIDPQATIASATRADLADAAAAILLADGEYDNSTLELSGDQAWTYPEFAATVTDITGKAVQYDNVDIQTLSGLLRKAGANDEQAAWSVKLAQDIASGALSQQTGELSKILGRPTTSLEEALHEYL